MEAATVGSRAYSLALTDRRARKQRLRHRLFSPAQPEAPAHEWVLMTDN